MINNNRIEVSAAVLFALALLMPPLQGMAWWLILPCLITLVLGWRLTAFVILLGSYLYVETPVAGIYLLLLTVLLLMSILAAGTPSIEKSLPGSDMLRFRTVLGLLGLSVPVLILLMSLLVGAGARWADQQASGNRQTGISDSMSPDSVTRLVASTDLALRVRFEGEYQQQPPSAELLYWRGVVLENFDGKTWTRDQQLEFNLAASPIVAPENTLEVSYVVSQQPNREFWLYGLNEAWVGINNVHRDTRGILVTRVPVRQTLRYPVTSYISTHQQLLTPADKDIQLDEISRMRNLALPQGSNPLSVEWAKTLRQQFSDDMALTNYVLEHFRDNNFFYTVTPTAMEEQGIDDFLFAKKEGFCGHYASALTFVLRAAGIPSRILGGYQGGEFNHISNHLSVYQYNAHSWVEAWYPNLGWVQLDPTAWVAPERVNFGMEAWLLDSGSQQDLSEHWRLRLKQLPGFVQLSQVMDAFAYQSDLWFFDDEGELRADALSRWLEQRGLGELPVWLMGGVLIYVILRALSQRGANNVSLPVALKTYLKFAGMMDKQGLGRMPGETINNHLLRIASTRPELAHDTAELMGLLNSHVYGQVSSENSRIKKIARRFRV